MSCARTRAASRLVTAPAPFRRRQVLRPGWRVDREHDAASIRGDEIRDDPPELREFLLVLPEPCDDGRDDVEDAMGVAIGASGALRLGYDVPLHALRALHPARSRLRCGLGSGRAARHG